MRTSDAVLPTCSQVLTVAQMRAAEEALIAGGDTVDSLMQIAGGGAAEWVWRVAAGRPVTVLCGPGNNGGDGYVIAEALRRRGLAVTVVAPMEPKTGAAQRARAAYGGTLAEGGKGGVFVDCLFGSGLTRPLGAEFADLVRELARHHHYRVAIDLPSGVASDSGALLDEDLPHYGLTVALGAWKFAHWLMPAMERMGDRRLVAIGVDAVGGAATLLARPRFAAPPADAHKYTRGLVLVVGGGMAGASMLACEGALRAGAGAVRLSSTHPHPSVAPDVVLKDQPLAELLEEKRTNAVLVGPGLGLDDGAKERLASVLQADLPTVADADALTLLTPNLIERRSAALILTPHAGEMDRLATSFAIEAEGKVARAQALAGAARAVVVAKGPDTVIATPDGRVVLAPSPSSWLAVAGTGDVLAGAIASRLAAIHDPFDAACQAVWLHGEAARLAGPAFLASELAKAVSRAYAAAL
uniref:NAD(P)H-hydrate dehydratase n=1 Tax=Altererythrobacter segetis TaxID=1104773 RepID=UPI00140C1BFC|nr:NAD(P)H-hydrate dehydratase [Altererythrobacter segetis]